jgi:hypothetical protein
MPQFGPQFRRKTLEKAARAVQVRSSAQVARDSDYEETRNALIPTAEAHATLRAGPYPGGGGLPKPGPKLLDQSWADTWNRAFHAAMALLWRDHVAQVEATGQCHCH